ncbi:MAG TPA: CPBP family intramembrane glutamate endopeptidase, partial [Corynebacterium sp.]|nr:CPBP family intramembrane glutamate endopeptidase [Corynebacterium sp.]
PEETGVMPALVPAERPAATPAPRPDPTPEPEEAAGTETAAGGLGPVLLMAAVGIIVGIIVFIVFEQLWGALNPWLTGMLALLVTAAMVIAVRALDTTRNSLTMILAGLVGLATAFAPALIAL